jgi:LmbE family N-acetylglucosaminyl deacetylase
MFGNRVLILSPHTDDAELGCGGLITKLIEEKKEILWVVFSTAEESLPKHLPSDTLVKEFISVMNHLGLNEKQYIINYFKVRKLNEKRQEILDLLVELRRSFMPDLVIGPSLNDFHQDHKTVSEEMIRAYKSNASIICYELPWNHVSFDTQVFVKLEERHMLKKLELLQHYKSQLEIERFYFSEDFIRGLACTRGAQVTHKYAEAFEVIRWIF